MQVGDAVQVRMTKWGERPHWEFDGRWLGEDEHGEWLGFPAGTPHRRPGMAFDSEVDTVTLLPPGRWWVATFHAPGIWCDTYVDISTPPVRDGSLVTAVDLDLDVVRRASGEWYVDDEDEFAEHQVAYGYPSEVVAAAEAARDEVWTAATERRGAFDGSAASWLERLALLLR